MPHTAPAFILTLSCANRPGIVAAVATHLARDQWADWLDPNVPASEVLKYLPAGSLLPTQVYPPPGNNDGQATLAL